MHSRMPTLSRTLFFDNFMKLTVIFVILFHKAVVRNSLDINLLDVNNKKNLQSNAHFALVIYYYLSGKNISLERRCLALILLAST